MHAQKLLREQLKPGGRRFGLGNESQRDQGVCSEEIERDGAVARVRQHLLQRGVGRVAERGRDIGSTRYGTGVLLHPRAERFGRGYGVQVEPETQGRKLRVCLGHPPSSQAATMPGVASRAAASREGSPAPAEAKWGRPPPLPPLTAAMRLTSSPADRPAATRSSLSATCTAPRPAVPNSTRTAARLPSRNRSATR